MCGIAGAVVFDGHDFRVTRPYVERLRDSMAHRGPDGSGVWIDERGIAGLGHRRLSIIDLTEAAAQPMGNAAGTLWITYNGEIYNHADVRTELQRLGRTRWKTDHSDTEVILQAYEEWGVECLQRFRGMFAFALWDTRSRELLLVRDRIGIKPLYYSVHDGRIVFASEIKALLEDPQQARRVNEEAFFHYLSFLTAPAPQTLFDGIMKLEAATYLRVRGDGHIECRRYWDVWDHTRPLVNVPEEEVVQAVLSELRTAVRIHKVGDVAVGVALSGGIDSSTNAALFSEDDTNEVNTFTIGYDAEYPTAQNELAQARIVADRFHTNHHERRLTQDDLLSFLPQMVRLQDEPIADPVCVPVYYLSKLVRDNGIKVCQLGEGADELFCGYHTWDLRLQLQRYDDLPVPRVFKKGGLSLLSLLGMEHEFHYEYLRRGSRGDPIFWSGAETYTQRMKERLLSARLRKRFAGHTSWEPLAATHRRFREKAWDRSHLNWMTYADLNLRLPELLLMRVDKMGMGTSVEGRVPFLDHKFVELVMSIPAALKTKNRELKYVLKKAVRGVIPDEVIDRRKQGFAVPVHEWISDRLGVYAATELKQFCDESDLLDWHCVQRLLQDPRRRSMAWNVLNMGLWWKEYIR
jgi:asparagine synthase (glutamine-hydrolysing)